MTGREWCARRSRVVVPNVGAMECDHDEACRIAAEVGGHVEVSEIALNADGSVRLGAWRRDHAADVVEAPVPCCDPADERHTQPGGHSVWCRSVYVLGPDDVADFDTAEFVQVTDALFEVDAFLAKQGRERTALIFEELRRSRGGAT